MAAGLPVWMSDLFIDLDGMVMDFFVPLGTINVISVKIEKDVRRQF